MKDVLHTKFRVSDIGGLTWFPGLIALHKTRTHITHYFPEWQPPGTWPPELDGLVSGRLITASGDATMHWTSRLYTPKVARDLIAYAEKSIFGFDKAAGWAA